ncbi:efflux transporter outer membrane subunit [Rhizorhapis suberifaciens]|uniref:Multidrug efflux system outer membrane protein n=1 Tax=Rhizorhapis suberifaciens TaxID=13656 RepID=A0A840HX18_9SPHN|nr:efflux transporter outer membrane subunit [Rhizorhapis suberifaciens]MBB4642503.1 multidrug efflux system outer membrane protein [Rhizorhapis suberifaciens]
MRKLLPIGMALVLLSGCQLAPPHVRPELPTASNFPESSSSDNALGERAVDISWRTFFADPRLRELVDAALRRNRNLAIAVARIEEARGLYRVQAADRLPTLGATGDATRSRTPGTVTGISGAQANTDTLYSVGVGVTGFELDFWGRVRNLSDAARSEYLATIEAQRAFRLTLIRDVASTYFASREADERIALAEATVRSRREGLRIAKRRLDAGVTSALDFRQAESLLTQAETELAGLRLAKAQSDNFLAVLTGGPLPLELPGPLALASQKGGPVIAAGLPSDLMLTRPDILAAEAQLRAARANIGAARAAFFPNISLTGSAGFGSTDLDNLVGRDGLSWSFGPSISLPIFDWGRRKGNLNVALAREDIAVATYEATVQQAFREVADALAGRQWLADQVAAQLRATEAQRQIARLARTRYREGVVGYLEVLDAERSLFTAEQTLIQVRRTELDNLVSLYVALGGGVSQGD